MAECRALRVEAYGYVRGVLIADYIFEGVYESENCRCVEAGTCGSWHFDKSVVCAEDKSVCIE